MEQDQIEKMIKIMKEEIVGAISTKLDAKFDETLRSINSKVNQNEKDIIEIKDKQNENSEKITNLTAKVDVDNDQLVDNTERLDKIDKDAKCYELRLKEVENTVDKYMNEKVNIGKIETQIKELKDSMNKSINNKSFVDAVKTPPSKQAGPSVSKSVSKSPSSPNKDLFKEARGKVGLYPITIDDIKKFTEEEDDDICLMTKYKHINTRHNAAQQFLVDEMNFGWEEIKIQTIKMAANWNSKIMWIEIGEENVNRLISRSIALKNPKIQIVTYFPAQLWNKRKQLNDIMKEKRKENPNLKYQIKVGKNDLILKTKMENEYIWADTPIGEFMPKPNSGLYNIIHQDSPVFKKNNKRNISPEADNKHKRTRQ